MDVQQLRDIVTDWQCTNKCLGHARNSGGCCTMGDRDFIMGPVGDAAAVVERLSEHFGRPVTHAEVFIDYEEGRHLFPARSCWQNPANFPAMRVLPGKPRIPCQYYDLDRKQCTVYAARPSMCRSYECHWLKDVLEKVS